ncbi:hypothetical protein A6723_013130 [Pseudomonas sp. AU11447]|uniref:hypothetical protein n=1 Tax=Pseudomonas TaxID=286 RepID=UPI0006D3B059|nr:MULTISPECIES: hypothetical protein [Pseudomonas]OBY89808.1 hypothetical protein A6723_013130 [Pseudomonas sp. AU11447]
MSIDPKRFANEYQNALVEVALPAFARAGEFARDHGLECSVELREGRRDLPELVLSVRDACQAADCVCRISADPSTQRLCHENRCGETDADVQRVVGSIASLNERVLDTRLLEFFQEAFALHLDYASRRHAGGFW